MDLLLLPFPQYGGMAWFPQSLFGLKFILGKNHFDCSPAVLVHDGSLFTREILCRLELVEAVDKFKALDRTGRTGCDFINKVRHD